MKKIVVIILLICLCFLTGCSSMQETGFDEHYQKNPYIYMGLRCTKEKMIKDKVEVELSYGWEEYPSKVNKNSYVTEEMEFKGIVIGVTDYGPFSYPQIYEDKNGDLICPDIYNLKIIDEKQCKDEKYLVNITGFRKPIYNHSEKLIIDHKNIINDKNKMGYFHINIGQLFYSEKGSTYVCVNVNCIYMYYEMDDAGFVKLKIME